MDNVHAQGWKLFISTFPLPHPHSLHLTPPIPSLPPHFLLPLHYLEVVLLKLEGAGRRDGVEGDRVEDHTVCVLYCIEEFRLGGILRVMGEGGEREEGGGRERGGRGRKEREGEGVMKEGESEE